MSTVEHPNHYGGDVPTEPIKVIRIWGLDFSLGNAVKYISRAGKKDPAKKMEDLEKARFYLDDEIKALQHEGSERVAVVAITEEELDVIVQLMPVREEFLKAWEILRRLHDEAQTARVTMR